MVELIQLLNYDDVVGCCAVTKIKHQHLVSTTDYTTIRNKNGAHCRLSFNVSY
jgi:hypothetical protein